MSNFVSNLAPKLNDFIKFKNSLGIQYASSRYYLKQLDKYNLKHGNYDVLRKDITEGWANQHSSKTISRGRSWIPPIREFGRYLQSMGYQDNYILDDRYIVQPYRAEVYLMRDDEIQAFFKECDSYVLKTGIPGRKYVYPALFRFMFCCGEARNLKSKDVHLDKGFVDILQSKALRDRRLYLSEELIDYLSQYDTAISKCFPSREYFLPSTHGGIISSCSLQYSSLTSSMECLLPEVEDYEV